MTSTEILDQEAKVEQTRNNEIGRVVGTATDEVHAAVMTQSSTQRAFVVCALALVLMTHGPGTTKASAPPRTSTIRLELSEAGEVSAQDLLRLVLQRMGSGVDVPEDTLDGSIPVSSLQGRFTIYALDKLLSPRGVGMEIDGDALVLTLDEDKLAGHLDALEETLREAFGGERPRYRLTRVEGSDPSGPPVVMLHGLDAASRRLDPAARAMAGQGYDVYLFTYPNDGRIITSARALGVELRALRSARERPISVVTVSMGGLVALAAVELDPQYDGAVERLVACAPPFGGAPMARYQLLTEAVDTVRGLLEGEHAGLVIFDGLSQASSDLRPGSPLLAQLERSSRRDDVRLSIIAGRGEVVSDASLEALELALQVSRPETRAGKRLALDLLLEATVTACQTAGGRGDGAVTLESQSLRGVTDRVITPFNHLQFLTAASQGDPIRGLQEVLARLPTPPKAH